MKTARFPSVRVEPDLRSEIESLLKEGETLSAFVASSVREEVRRRQLRDEFIRRGLAGLEASERSGIYHAPDEVVGELRQILSEEKTKAATRTES